ncbi:hypothetical protein AVEN_187116-1 [Araneus ventricosus]|uniref:Uncharacterized protein n=1 Tax=Araneus ventricosus TaxID=182803 RepID=A0A4Y2ETP0_ARAVE|nr:hypothetical protein AVEN_187116-1 [Araneus ventricosus]
MTNNHISYIVPHKTSEAQFHQRNQESPPASRSTEAVTVMYWDRNRPTDVSILRCIYKDIENATQNRNRSKGRRNAGVKNLIGEMSSCQIGLQKSGRTFQPLASAENTDSLSHLIQLRKHRQCGLLDSHRGTDFLRTQ